VWCEVRAAPSAVLKLMTSYVAFAVIGLFVMLIFVDNVSAKSDRLSKPRLKVASQPSSFTPSSLWPPCIAGCGHIYFHPVVSSSFYPLYFLA